jgi:hypothetical protein
MRTHNSLYWQNLHEEVTMLNAPLTPVARTATYKIDYNNVNLINKPDIHVNVLVSDTNTLTTVVAVAEV